MTTFTISPGDEVLVRTAFGDEVRRRALTGPVRGEDFMVIWLATPDEWDRAITRGDTPDGSPWPVEDVRPL